MAAEPEEFTIAIADFGLPRLRQAVARAHQAGARTMLEPAITLAHDHHQELVRCHRRGLTEKADMMFADFFQVASQPLFVTAKPATEDNIVRNAAGFKMYRREIGHFHRVIDQIVIITGPVQAKFKWTGIDPL